MGALSEVCQGWLLDWAEADLMGMWITAVSGLTGAFYHHGGTRLIESLVSTGHCCLIQIDSVSIGDGLAASYYHKAVNAHASGPAVIRGSLFQQSSHLGSEAGHKDSHKGDKYECNWAGRRQL